MAQAATSTAAWREVLALFDRWAATGETQREALLEYIQQEHPALYPRLLAMIDADRVAEAGDFLGEGVPPLTSVPGETPWAGMRLGAWELREAIGQGGMGQVWLATRSDGLYNGRAAVKLLHAAGMGTQAQARFAREGEFLARLAHPHIGQLLDAGFTAGGARYLVLEYVQGERIDHWCDARKLGIDARLRLFMQVCSAVAYAHTHLVVHRDLKPANILVSDDGHVKLLDFGVAKLLVDADEHSDLTELTRAGAAGLTPEYAAPEQVEGGAITTATDVYALGVVLFGLLSGARPYGGTSRGVAAMARAIVEEPPRSLATALRESPDAASSRGTSFGALAQRIGGDLETIVAKTLKKLPSERYTTVQELNDDLQRFLRSEPVSARPDTFGYRARKFAQRNRAQVWALAAVMLALMAGVAAASWQWRAATQEAARTRSVLNVMTDLFRGLNPDQSGKATVPVTELLRRTWAETQLKLKDEAPLRAAMARPIGLLLSTTGDPLTAAEALETSYSYQAAMGKAATPEFLEVAFTLADTKRRLGQAERARALFEEVIAIGQQGGDATAAWPIDALAYLGLMAKDDGRFDEATALLNQAAEQAKRRFGKEHRLYANATEDLADIALARGQWKLARELFADLVAARAQGTPLEKARARQRAADADVVLGRYDAAEPELRSVVTDFIALLGENDTNTIYARTWWAMALFHQGRVAESEEVIAQAHRHAGASGEPEVKHNVQIVMARHAVRRDDVARAEPLLRETLSFFEAAGDANRRDAERARTLLGECQLRRGHLDSAIDLLSQVAHAQEGIFGQATNLDQWPTRLLLALARDARDGVSAAMPDYEQAERIANAVLAPEQPDRYLVQSIVGFARWRKAPAPDTRRNAQEAFDHHAQMLSQRSDRHALSVLTNRMMAGPISLHLPRDMILPLLAY